MVQPAPASTDRLPWLTEVPRAAPPPEKKKARFPWEWVVATLLVFGFAAIAYWIGTRQRDPGAPPPASVDVNAVPAAPEEDLAGVPSVSDMTDIRPVDQPGPASTQRSQPRPDQPTESELEQLAQPDFGEAGDDALSGPVVAIPSQPIVRGRIVQIGAYPTRAQADLAWQYVVKKWPYLATKPKLVSPIEVRSTDGKGTRMYRLQLATASQAQSVVICQRLESAKTSCVVVY